jgi:hypothetical protein
MTSWDAGKIIAFFEDVREAAAKQGFSCELSCSATEGHRWTTWVGKPEDDDMTIKVTVRDRRKDDDG